MKVVGRNFNPSLVGVQLTDINDNSILTYNNFRITKQITPKLSKNYNDSVVKISTTNSLYDNQQIKFYKNNKIIYENVNFGSSKEFFRVTILNILKNYPSGLYIRNTINLENIINIVDYTYDQNTNVSIFKIPIKHIVNDFDLIYYTSFDQTDTINVIKEKNIINYFNQYDIYYNGLTYSIVDFVPSKNKNGNEYIKLTVNGELFNNIENGNYSAELYIKPNFKLFKTVVDKYFSSFEKFLIKNLKNNSYYEFTIKVPFITDDSGVKLVDKTYKWYTENGINLDFESVLFETLFQDILEVGNDYDQLKTDFIFRRLTPDSLKDYDLSEFKNLEKVLRIYGRSFDDIKSVIDDISKIYHFNYNNINSTSDQLVYLICSNLGLKTFDIIDDEELLTELTNSELTIREQEELKSIDVNIELWKRLLINLNFLNTNKGTRKVLEFLFNFLGITEALYKIDEFVYYTDTKKINLTQNELVKSSGYPNMINNTNFYFQNKTYIEAYEDIGFNFTKINDNQKISLGINEQIINSKEFITGLDVTKQIEYDVYRLLTDPEFFIYFYNKGQEDTIPQYSIENTDFTELFFNSDTPEWYPEVAINYFEPRDNTFGEFVENTYKYFIDARNRKTIDDGHGGGYPTLRKIYFDYVGYRRKELCDFDPFYKLYFYNEGIDEPELENISTGFKTSENKYNIDDLYKYLEVFNINYLKLIDQFIPATTIANSGDIIRNTIFTQQKFVYKKGINEGSEFKLDIDNFLNKYNLSGGLFSFDTEGVSFNNGNLNIIIEEVPDITTSVLVFTTSAETLTFQLSGTTGVTYNVDFGDGNFETYELNDVVQKTYLSGTILEEKIVTITMTSPNTLNDITALYFSNTSLTGTFNFEGLNNLTYIDFSNNNLTNLTNLENIINTENLNYIFTNNEFSKTTIENIITNISNNNSGLINNRFIDFRDNVVSVDVATENIINDLQINSDLTILVGIDLPENAIIHTFTE